MIVKLEPKWGFRAYASASELDKQISGGDNPRLPKSMLFRPVDLMTRPDGTRYPTLDAAARANNWPAMSQLRGTFMFYVIDGTLAERDLREGAPVPLHREFA